MLIQENSETLEIQNSPKRFVSDFMFTDHIPKSTTVYFKLSMADLWEFQFLEGEQFETEKILLRYQEGCQPFDPGPDTLQHFINNLNEKVAEICIKFAGATNLCELAI